jgi:hypothetical protein
MAVKKTSATKEPKARQKAETEPKFPYTTKPSSLRRLLQEIPKKPKPPKFDRSLLKSWGFTDANDYSMIRVLKAIGLLGSNTEPSDLYSQYMRLDGGAAALAEPIKQIYEPLFHASHTPYKESNEKLQNLFNIHSGGGERALDQQIQTFKALCEYTSFENAVQAQQQPSATSVSTGSGSVVPPQPGAAAPAVHINVHIHLPENKSRRDYEAIIEDIGRYIFGRTDSGRRDE